MYFGSVRFFKHLIFAALLALILVPAAIAVFLGVTNARLRTEISSLGSQVEAAAGQTEKDADSEQPAIEAIAYNQDLLYQNLYPDLYVQTVSSRIREEGVVYLTFDDGPSEMTDEILEVLKQKNVKATFFIIGSQLKDVQNQERLKKIVQSGHKLGIHSYSHQMETIYNSVDAYLQDFYRVYKNIYDVTGVKADIFRFPGGSINAYNSAIYQELIAEMTRRGFVYFDWNVSAHDDVANATMQQVLVSVVPGAKENYRSIVLLHDNKISPSTPHALPEMIDELRAAGLKFDVLSNHISPVIFGYSD